VVYVQRDLSVVLVDLQHTAGRLVLHTERPPSDVRHVYLRGCQELRKKEQVRVNELTVKATFGKYASSASAYRRSIKTSQSHNMETG
jgi:hypothetical protein